MSHAKKFDICGLIIIQTTPSRILFQELCLVLAQLF